MTLTKFEQFKLILALVLVLAFLFSLGNQVGSKYLVGADQFPPTQSVVTPVIENNLISLVTLKIGNELIAYEQAKTNLRPAERVVPKGEKLNISGRASKGARLILTVESTKKTEYTVLANDKGIWQVDIATQNLSIGVHSVNAQVRNEDGTLTDPEPIAVFRVGAPEVTGILLVAIGAIIVTAVAFAYVYRKFEEDHFSRRLRGSHRDLFRTK